MASRLNPTNFGYQNFYSALLTADITAGSLTLSLDTVPTPTSGILVIDPDSTTSREVILYTSKGASTITCPTDGRGFDGTTAVAHLTGTTVIYAPVSKLFSALASGELSTDPLRTESFFDYVASGAVWSGDSYGVSLAASMTAGVCYINGRRLTIAAVTAHAFTASKDTYIDAADNDDGTVLLTYTEVANNAASPALAANSIRLGIIQSAATITAATKVNQGQEDKVFPIASSIPYAVTDSLGNLICPRDPNRKILGQRQLVANFSSGTTAETLITGLNMPVIIPTLRKVRLTLYNTSVGSAGVVTIKMYDGVFGSGGTQLQQGNSIGGNGEINVEWSGTPSTTSKTYTFTIASSSGNPSFTGGATTPAIVRVELL